METKDLTKDPNHIAYLKLLEKGELIFYVGTHIAIVGGNLVDNDLKGDALLGRVREQFPNGTIYLRRVPRPDEEETVGDMPRVFRIEDKI